MDALGRVFSTTGASGAAHAVWLASDARTAQLGSPTGNLGLYGASGGPQLATGTAGITGLTGIGASGFGSVWFNGGSGSYYTLPDVVTALKNAGILKP